MRRGETFKGLKLSMRKSGDKMATVHVKLHLTQWQMEQLIAAYQGYFGGNNNVKTLRDALHWFSKSGILEAIENNYENETEYKEEGQ